MRYIKYNKPSLDYNQFSDFHAFTMNNLVRNIMRNGKYKKAVKLVRLGLLYGLKELFEMLAGSDEGVARTFRPLPRTYLTEKTKDNYLYNLTGIPIKDVIAFDEQGLANFKPIHQQFLKTSHQINTSKECFDYLFESYYANIKSKDSRFQFGKLYPIEFDEIEYNLEKHKEKLLLSYYGFKHLVNSKLEIASKNQQNREVVLNKYNKDSFQYHKLEKLEFIKLYTKKQHTYYYGIRDLTVFDMVLQVYTMLTGAWYMRKAKVSGRTILIPSPLRPYRRIVTVTKMLLKGIEKRRHIQRAKKNAMVDAFGTEFCWLLFYNGFQYTPTNNFANSDVWAEKMASHKELVANLKNIKYLKYF